MARKFKPETQSGKTVLLVDDNADYLEATRRILVREGHKVLTERDGKAALGILTSTTVDLLLLDYFMPGMTGEEVVAELRKFNTTIQVILQTGYASENPPRELLRRLDIQGYYDKSEGTEKLLLWVDVGLKAAYTVQMLSKSRRGLDYILSVTPQMHKIQPLDELLQGILLQISGLLGTTDSFLAVLPQPESDPAVDGFLAILDGNDADLRIHAGVGRYADRDNRDCAIPAAVFEPLRAAMQSGRLIAGNGVTLVPLRVGEASIGVIYLDREIIESTDIELLKVFANQAAVAIQNTQLYEMAAMDPLTGTFVRRFFDRFFIRELKAALRSKAPVSLLMLDMDDMKGVNDSGGHLVGDKALLMFAQSLKEATRSSDLVSRFGGDEFSVLLLKSDTEGTEQVVRRIIEKVRSKTLAYAGGEHRLQVSVGSAVLLPPTREMDVHVPEDYFLRLALRFQQLADESLYEAKRDGGDRAGSPRILTWLDSSELPEISEPPASAVPE